MVGRPAQTSSGARVPCQPELADDQVSMQKMTQKTERRLKRMRTRGCQPQRFLTDAKRVNARFRRSIFSISSLAMMERKRGRKNTMRQRR